LNRIRFVNDCDQYVNQNFKSIMMGRGVAEAENPMNPNVPSHICGIFILSEDPARLAGFYREAIGLPLSYDHAAAVNGENGAEHYECDFGPVHFAIHPARGRDLSHPNHAMNFMLAIADLDGFVARLRSMQIELLYGPLDLDFGRLAGVLDPDGNTVQLTELRG
jgi:predicted enzyme related to lactoylglutathione lyase